MRLSILPFLILCAASAQGAVVHVPIKSSLDLKPGEAYTISVDATQPTEIGWQTVQAKRCTTNCVQATDVTGGVNYSIATPQGASTKYTPVSGKIAVEYKNLSGDAVTINVYRVRRTCEAEACKFLDESQKGRWLVFKIDEFKSIAEGTIPPVHYFRTSHWRGREHGLEIDRHLRRESPELRRAG